MFDYQTEHEKAMTYRKLEVPFVVHNDPSGKFCVVVCYDLFTYIICIVTQQVSSRNDCHVSL
jgi:predicted amidohydrolase